VLLEKNMLEQVLFLTNFIRTNAVIANTDKNVTRTNDYVNKKNKEQILLVLFMYQMV
jgi:hypothetical protein